MVASMVLYQGMSFQLSEKLDCQGALCQGTTSVVPDQAHKQRGFSP
jgi:hypothetical protein